MRTVFAVESSSDYAATLSRNARASRSSLMRAGSRHSACLGRCFDLCLLFCFLHQRLEHVTFVLIQPAVTTFCVGISSGTKPFCVQYYLVPLFRDLRRVVNVLAFIEFAFDVCAQARRAGSR